MFTKSAENSHCVEDEKQTCNSVTNLTFIKAEVKFFYIYSADIEKTKSKVSVTPGPLPDERNVLVWSNINLMNHSCHDIVDQNSTLA